MEFKRGIWYKKYINCYEDKRDYDFLRRGYLKAREELAKDYCIKNKVMDLSDIEKHEVDEFWAQYGIKIYDYSWHKMYKHVSGTFDVKYIPDLIMGTIVYPYYNDSVYENTWRDKNMFSRLLPNVPFPTTFLKCIRNRIYFEGKYYVRSIENNQEFLEQLLYKIGKNNFVIVKDTRATGFGQGVKKYQINTTSDILKIFKDWIKSQNFIIQQCLKQHKELEKFNKSSVNMMRVFSYRHEDKVDIIYACVRAGIEGQISDISFIDGVEMVKLVGIKDGCFDNKMIDQDGKVIKKLEDGVKVPSWDKIERIVKENHLLIDNFDMIGWDFTIDENGTPYCFEWNIQWPGTVFYQYANGPLLGNKTEKILEFLKDENNQYNYIPNYFKLKK
ncbi:MAG: hypothetical protein J6Q58_00370 [Clostridia bacterium]|nr:hypothetical protein [Clostridia bacterium]